MDIDALIAAAKEIDRKAGLKEERSIRYQELAEMARKVVTGSREHEQIKREARHLSTTVIDYGDALNDLRRALRKKPKKPHNP